MTESTPLSPFHILAGTDVGPMGNNSVLPHFGEKEGILSERDDNTRVQLWDDANEGDDLTWK